MQTQVKKLLKQHGMDLGLMSCCVVNQACLAFDARDAAKLAASMEKLLGTWDMRQVGQSQPHTMYRVYATASRSPRNALHKLPQSWHKNSHARSSLSKRFQLQKGCGFAVFIPATWH